MQLWRKTVVYACPPPSEKCLSNVSVSYGQCSLDIYITGLTSYIHIRLYLIDFTVSFCAISWRFEHVGFTLCVTLMWVPCMEKGIVLMLTYASIWLFLCVVVFWNVSEEKIHNTGHYISPLQIWLMGKHKTHQWIKKTNQSVFYLSWFNLHNYSLEILKHT